VVVAGCASPGHAENSALKSRRHVSAWVPYAKTDTFEKLAPAADILDSVSICGDMPSAGLLAQCRKRGIVTYRLVSGDTAAFDTEEHARATLDGYLALCREPGLDGIDLDFENLDPKYRDAYGRFIAMTADALHRIGKKLSICVYTPLTELDAAPSFWIPELIGRHCDVIKVMCYDLNMAPGLYASWWPLPYSPGFGPTSTQPWARQNMRYWMQRVPPAKLLMGLPAYGNDYVAAPGGRGEQIYAPLPPIPAGKTNEVLWLTHEQVHVYRYLDAQDRPHIFYASDARSTRAHLATIDELDLPGLTFWHYDAVAPETWQAVRSWLARPPVAP
jgi:spore germination protein YaaH